MKRRGFLFWKSEIPMTVLITYVEVNPFTVEGFFRGKSVPEIVSLSVKNGAYSIHFL